MPEVGQVLCEHILLEGKAGDGVGVGALGPVFAARDRTRDLPLWVTILDFSLFPTSLALSQFMAAANGLLTLRHPGLLPLAVVDREEAYCVIGHERWPDTRSLADVLHGGDAPDEEQVGRCAIALAKTLDFLHGRGLVHGLMAPASCFVWEQTYLLWQHGLAPLCDRGVLARRAGQASDWLRPDLLQAHGPTSSLDVYGWGVTMAQMAYPGGDAAEAVNAVLDGNPEVRMAKGLQTVVRVALQSDPRTRPSSGSALLVALEPLIREGTRPGHSARERWRPGSDETASAAASSEALQLEDFEELQVTRSSAPPPIRSHVSRRAGPKSAPQVQDHLPPAAPEPDLMQLVEASASRLAGPEAEPFPSFPEPLIPPVPVRPPPPTESFPNAYVSSSDSIPVRLHQPPRLPGPHGPNPAVMLTGLLAICTLVPILAFLHTVGERGGLTGVVGAEAVDTSPATTAPGDPRVRAEPTSPASDSPSGGEDEPLDTAASSASAPVPPSGGTDAEVPPSCPSGMAAVGDATCIDVGEWPGLRRKPRVGVTFGEAAALCKSAGKRLCTPDEWLRACEGPSSFSYPYGPSYLAGACNTASVAGFPAELSIAGAHPRCKTPAGVFDLVGNAGEWVANGFAVGGDRLTEGALATCQAQGQPPGGYAGEDLGFRCCAVR